MESNRIYTYIFKYTFLGLALITISLGSWSYFNPNVMTINGETRQLNETELLISMAVGLIFLVIYALLRSKFALVDLGDNMVRINNFQENIEAKWTEVELIKRIPGVKPPLYRVKLKDREKFYLFTTQPKFIKIGSSFVDTSDMGNRISKMKRELEI